MIGKLFYRKVWDRGFWEKTLISSSIFLAFGALIYLFTVYLDSGYPLFLLFLPLIFTSGFYFKRWNFTPSILCTLSLTVLSIFHYGQDFFDYLPLTILNLSVFFILYSIISILVGNVNVYFKRLRKEKQNEATAREEAEERKEFLNTLIRQDLGSKHQTINGYLQLLEEAELHNEHREYLRKALKAGKEADEILELAKKLEEEKEAEWLGEKDLATVMNHVLDDISDLAERESVEIKNGFSEDLCKVEGDYSLKILFSQILKTRIQTSGCDRIEIDITNKENGALLSIRDNGEQLPEDIKKLFDGELYTGETSGAGGARYYMLEEIAERNNAKILVRDSKLGGAEFDISLQCS